MLQGIANKEKSVSLEKMIQSLSARWCFPRPIERSLDVRFLIVDRLHGLQSIPAVGPLKRSVFDHGQENVT
ncbi:hypothetical protein [Labrenzia sp. 011]|uniref:hypothetical protein n=1 Tax=Labrenzia sp. 011 TaxID=2171494 RepID=UPI001403BBB9|nr:hypothetical protein [Labrenzia sp. 011]